MTVIGPFSERVTKWTVKGKKHPTKVFREATKELLRQAQLPVSQGGNMPVRTGFLRSSCRVSLRGMPSPIPGYRGKDDARYSWNASSANATIDSARLDKDRVYIGWLAEYTEYQENEKGFVRLARQNWRSIVNRVAERVAKED